ncbi:Queuosine Biosynthesis QueE Radical SAM [hydrothermal vent metagenome]|uniref:Queuosine Biosynthesis QueE Radical SAM n=1 Tax=hydrothermal vent metagenome TaxID=652676 RepID=A0A1W1EHW1_9ZZZZ
MKQEGDTLYLVESFFSIQGEGRYAGTPSVFFRFGGCNLNCKGFGVKQKSPIDDTTLVGCDSIRATYSEHYKYLWQKIDSENLLIDILENYLAKSCKPDIVITGGEPLLWYNHEIFLNFLNFLVEGGFRITIETNATIMIDFTKYPLYKNITFAMSVKLKNSGEQKEKRVNKDAIKAIATHSQNSFFKFVLSKNSLYHDEIIEITKDINLPIYCMPMGSTAKELAKNDKAVAQFCINHCYKYVDRMHIRLWDNEEGR